MENSVGEAGLSDLPPCASIGGFVGFVADQPL